MIKNITYNSFDLQDSNFLTKQISYRNLPKKVIDIQSLSRNDGFKLLSSRYESKEITISGKLMCSSEVELRTKLIAMKKALDIDEANLDIDDDDNPNVIRFVATVSNIEIEEEHYYISDVPYTISFIAQPFGKSTSTSTITNSFATTTATISINLTGSAGSKPILTYLVTQTPSSAITAVAINNTTTTDTISVSGLSLDAKNEYLEIDCNNMTVKKYQNSTLTNSDFTGIFPSFIAGTNSIYITLTGGGATKRIRQTVSYYPYFI